MKSKHCDRTDLHDRHTHGTTEAGGTCPGYPAPAVGQLWADNDRRAPERYLLIAELSSTHAAVRQAAYSPETGVAAVLPGARLTRIRLDRLRPTSTGYRYVTSPGRREGKGE